MQMRETFPRARRALPSAKGLLTWRRFVPGHRHVPGNHCGSTAPQPAGLRRGRAERGDGVRARRRRGLLRHRARRLVASASPTADGAPRGGVRDPPAPRFGSNASRGATSPGPWRGGWSTKASRRSCSPTSTTSTTTAISPTSRGTRRSGRLRRRGGLPLGDRLHRAPDHHARAPRRRRDSDYRCTRSPGTCSASRRARPRRAARRRPAGDRARRGADAEPLLGDYEGMPAFGASRRRGGVAAPDPRLAMVRAVQLPGDRAPWSGGGNFRLMYLRLLDEVAGGGVDRGRGRLPLDRAGRDAARRERVGRAAAAAVDGRGRPSRRRPRRRGAPPGRHSRVMSLSALSAERCAWFGSDVRPAPRPIRLWKVTDDFSGDRGLTH